MSEITHSIEIETQKARIIAAIESLVREKTLPPKDTQYLALILTSYKQNRQPPAFSKKVARRLAGYINQRLKRP